MNFDSVKLAEEEKKKKEKSEKKKKEEELKILEFEKQKKEAREQKESDDIISKLEEMLEDGELSDNEIDTLKKIVEENDITEQEIEVILEKLEEIEKTQDIDKYLPKEFRITAKDYRQSLTDDIKRLQTITKLDTALGLLANHVKSDTSMGLNLFSGYMVILDKKLIRVQENTIDIKDCLKKVEEKKQASKKNSFKTKFKLFLKDLFN